MSARATSGPAMTGLGTSAAHGAGDGAAAVGVRAEKSPATAQTRARAKAREQARVQTLRTLPLPVRAPPVRALLLRANVVGVAVPPRRPLRTVILHRRRAPPRHRLQAPAPTISTSSGRPRQATLRVPGRTIGRLERRRLKRLCAPGDGECADASSRQHRRTRAPRLLREERPLRQCY